MKRIGLFLLVALVSVSAVTVAPRPVVAASSLDAVMLKLSDFPKGWAIRVPKKPASTLCGKPKGPISVKSVDKASIAFEIDQQSVKQTVAKYSSPDVAKKAFAEVAKGFDGCKAWNEVSNGATLAGRVSTFDYPSKAATDQYRSWKMTLDSQGLTVEFAIVAYRSGTIVETFVAGSFAGGLDRFTPYLELAISRS
jgi:hypothetical protein